jgi:hypothetical protein
VATGGKWGSVENGSGRRKPLPWVATGCRVDRMVRRGRRIESVREGFDFSLLSDSFQRMRDAARPMSTKRPRRIETTMLRGPDCDGLKPPRERRPAELEHLSPTIVYRIVEVIGLA